jgi:hypothetical protein
MAKVDPMDGKAQTGFHNECRIDKARVHTVASEGKPINVLDWFVIWEGGISERYKQSMEQNTKTKNMNLTSNKTQPRWTQTQQSNKNENLRL